MRKTLEQQFIEENHEIDVIDDGEFIFSNAKLLHDMGSFKKGQKVKTFLLSISRSLIAISNEDDGDDTEEFELLAKIGEKIEP